ncbi:hypothetical protein [Bosea psychrotolerans]|uniref:hypothetical protein n=1 Tax=Bosea psychrotolerans TaxID=1871628 RepID=UPI000CDA6761|nr:hypothetical protein [Bosea psychrotolerans]
MASGDRVDRVLPGAYVLKADDLKSVEALLNRELGSEAKCILTLGIDRRSEYESVEAMLTDTFLYKESIESISLEGSNGHLRASVDFRRSFVRPISMHLSGQRNEVLALEKQIENLIEGPRQWYSWVIAPFGQHIQAAVLVWLTALAGLVLISFAVGVEVSGGKAKPSVSTAALVLLGVSLSWIVLPSMIFAIGKGQKRWEMAKAVLSVFFLSIAIAAFANLVTAIWNPLQSS